MGDQQARRAVDEQVAGAGHGVRVVVRAAGAGCAASAGRGKNWLVSCLARRPVFSPGFLSRVFEEGFSALYR